MFYKKTPPAINTANGVIIVIHNYSKSCSNLFLTIILLIFSVILLFDNKSHNQ
ncbi:hypothetical protein HMPREF9104_00883 [Lentilactobacillus kisonensis F0435]|uniref:Uncharacterized protein n=1 Tax=Lentilactobacillus kisonensis F0435 TaxID=797516 RepID=H1LE57_9LACO|nr:hypothetical protein HMPREF9104_00883 [Lentilactobacillus kisonensis F0435]